MLLSNENALGPVSYKPETMRPITVFSITAPGYSATVTDKPTAVENIIRWMKTRARVIPEETINEISRWAESGGQGIGSTTTFRLGKSNISVQTGIKISRVEFKGTKDGKRHLNHR